VSAPQTEGEQRNSYREQRRELRRKRRALTPQQQRDHARRIARQLLRLGLLRSSRRVALYLANDGEPDTGYLIEKLRKRGIRCYLPVVATYPKYKMVFCHYPQGARLHPNRYGIGEPLSCRHRAPPWGLDVVLMPLVGFDGAGNRIGMGAGYYDRCFGYLLRRYHWRRPRLIGLAHSCQRLPQIAARPWDVALDGVVTEQETLLLCGLHRASGM